MIIITGGHSLGGASFLPTCLTDETLWYKCWCICNSRSSVIIILSWFWLWSSADTVDMNLFCSPSPGRIGRNDDFNSESIDGLNPKCENPGVTVCLTHRKVSTNHINDRTNEGENVKSKRHDIKQVRILLINQWGCRRIAARWPQAMTQGMDRWMNGRPEVGQTARRKRWQIDHLLSTDNPIKITKSIHRVLTDWSASYLGAFEGVDWLAVLECNHCGDADNLDMCVEPRRWAEMQSAGVFFM